MIRRANVGGSPDGRMIVELEASSITDVLSGTLRPHGKPSLALLRAKLACPFATTHVRHVRRVLHRRRL